MNETKSRLTDEEKELMAIENIKLVYYFVNKYKHLPYSYEEKVSAAMLGMAIALNNFDPTKGFAFSTFLAKCIRNYILKIKRTEEKHRRNISIENAVYQSKDGNSITILDTLSDGMDAEFDWEDLNEAVNKVFQGLTPKNKKVFELFIQGLKQREIGEIVGVKQVQVSRSLIKTMAAIKKEYWK